MEHINPIMSLMLTQVTILKTFWITRAYVIINQTNLYYYYD